MFAIPPPVPPSVKAGLTTTGNPIEIAISFDSCTELATALSGTGSPISFINFLNPSLSSDFSIVSIGEPSNFISYFSNIPA